MKSFIYHENNLVADLRPCSSPEGRKVGHISKNYISSQNRMFSLSSELKTKKEKECIFLFLLLLME